MIIVATEAGEIKGMLGSKAKEELITVTEGDEWAVPGVEPRDFKKADVEYKCITADGSYARVEAKELRKLFIARISPARSAC